MDERGRTGHSQLSAEQAFVVHLLETNAVLGRVEHVSSGRCKRFGSVAELIEFMRGTLGLADQDPGAEPENDSKEMA